MAWLFYYQILKQNSVGAKKKKSEFYGRVECKGRKSNGTGRVIPP